MSAVARDEGGLIERCRSRDRAAFEELVLKYQDRVYNLAYRLAGDAEDAADIVQEAFLKAYRNIEHFQGGSKFYTWMYRITVNTAVSRRRWSAARPRTVSLGGKQEDDGPMDPEDRSQADPSERAGRADVQRVVEAGMARLSDEHRVLIVLRDIEGRDYGEIAEILDCPRGTVKSRLHRARQELRAILSTVLPADALL